MLPNENLPASSVFRDCWRPPFVPTSSVTMEPDKGSPLIPTTIPSNARILQAVNKNASIRIETQLMDSFVNRLIRYTEPSQSRCRTVFAHHQVHASYSSDCLYLFSFSNKTSEPANAAPAIMVNTGPNQSSRRPKESGLPWTASQ